MEQEPRETTARTHASPGWRVRPLGVLCAFVASLLTPGGGLGGPVLYWCPHKTADQQIAATAEPGCVPLVEQGTPATTKKSRLTSRNPVRVENVTDEVTKFLDRYDGFLRCCATSPEALPALEDLDAHATEILTVVERELPSELMKLRGFMVRDMVVPVVQARARLRKLKPRLELIRDRLTRLEPMDSATAAKERRRVVEMRDSIEQEFRPRKPSEGPGTGREIGLTPPTGPEIGRLPPTGPEVGTTAPTGPPIGVTPSTGFEIGTTGRVGPDISESGPQKSP